MTLSLVSGTTMVMAAEMSAMVPKIRVGMMGLVRRWWVGEGDGAGAEVLGARRQPEASDIAGQRGCETERIQGSIDRELLLVVYNRTAD